MLEVNNLSVSFATGDGTFHLLKVRTGRDLHGYRETARWLDQVRGVVNSWQNSQPAAAPVRVAYTGSPDETLSTSSGSESYNTNLQGALNAEAQMMQDNAWKFYPILRIGVNFSF